jgi:hypothetical protein
MKRTDPKPSPKLVLARTTVRELVPAELQSVPGGKFAVSNLTPSSCL